MQYGTLRHEDAPPMCASRGRTNARATRHHLLLSWCPPEFIKGSPCSLARSSHGRLLLRPACMHGTRVEEEGASVPDCAGRPHGPTSHGTSVRQAQSCPALSFPSLDLHSRPSSHQGSSTAQAACLRARLRACCLLPHASCLDCNGTL